jgi:uncharacterized protein YecE (DUF72 family)
VPPPIRQPGGASRLYAGVSGYAYPEWLGDFYPEKLPSGRFLEHYAGQLPAVEINHTFHRIPGEKVVDHWLRATPEDFRLCLKVQRSITHSGLAFPKAEAAASFSRAVASAGDRLGPLLLDLPKAFKPDPARLDEILAALDRPAAVQFRDEGWFNDATWGVLERRGATAAIVDEEGVPKAERRPGAGFAYFRLRRGELLAEELDEVAGALEEGDVYAFVRHAPQAPRQARELLARLRPRPAAPAGRGTGSPPAPARS